MQSTRTPVHDAGHIQKPPGRDKLLLIVVLVPEVHNLPDAGLDDELGALCLLGFCCGCACGA